MMVLVGCMDFPVETVVTLAGSANGGSVTPVASSATAAAATVSEVVLPSPPLVSDAKSSPGPMNQSPPPPAAPLSPVDAEESPTHATAEAQEQTSSSRSNDVTTEMRLTESGTTTTSRPQDGVDDTAASIPVSELS